MERHYSRYWKEYRENRERKERGKAQKRTKAARTMVGVSLSSGLPGRRRLNYTRGVRATPPFIRRVITSARAPPLKRKKKKGKRKKPHASEQQQLTFCHDGNEAPSISKTTPYFHFSLSFFSLWDVIRGIIRDLQFSSLIMCFFLHPRDSNYTIRHQYQARCCWERSSLFYIQWSSQCERK